MTEFKEIYTQQELIKNDNRLIGKPSNQIYQLYFQYLKYAISIFTPDCYKDLSLYNGFNQQEYTYLTDGISNVFSLNPAPLYTLFYVGISPDKNTAYTEITPDKYVYDNTNNTITINGSILISNQYVYISNYNIGSFSEDLNFMEVSILAEAMLIPYTQEQLYKNSLMNQIVYGGEMKIYSQANHLDSLKNISNNQYFNIVKGMISEYSYKYSDKVKGLGGMPNESSYIY